MSTEKNTGGPAFPRALSQKNPNNPAPEIPAHDGMTLRDWFAGMALTGIAGNPGNTSLDCTDATKRAYILADAMLEARNK